MRILYLVILVFVLSFSIFYPAIGMHFCSDDFYVIKRLCIDKVFWTKGFFRPIGDLSLLLDYEIKGLNPALFHITNIIIHAINTCLVFSLCSNLPFVEEKQKEYFSYLATILFLTYPFHLESILWIVSRSSALGTMFGTLTLISYFKLHGRPAVYFVVAAFYAIGLMCFENILFIPLVIVMFELALFRNKKTFFKWSLIFSIVIALHLMFRLIFSGEIWGDYGGDKLFSVALLDYLPKTFKAIGRLFIPPSGNDLLMISSFSLIALSILLILYYAFKSELKYKPVKKLIIGLALALAISMIIPCMFGISTRTSEGDRLLYFPSVFFVSFISLLITVLIDRKLIKVGVVVVILSFQFYFLTKTQINWLTASNTILAIKGKVKSARNNRIVFINLPGEYEGAYIFRNGIYEAPLIWKLPHKEIEVLSIWNKRDYSNFKFPIQIKYNNNNFLTPFQYKINRNGNSVSISSLNANITVHKSDIVLFWDGVSINELDLFH